MINFNGGRSGTVAAGVGGTAVMGGDVASVTGGDGLTPEIAGPDDFSTKSFGASAGTGEGFRPAMGWSGDLGSSISGGFAGLKNKKRIAKTASPQTPARIAGRTRDFVRLGSFPTSWTGPAGFAAGFFAEFSPGPGLGFRMTFESSARLEEFHQAGKGGLDFEVDTFPDPTVAAGTIMGLPQAGHLVRLPAFSS